MEKRHAKGMCHACYSHAHYIENEQKYKDKANKWRVKNPDKKRENSKKDYQENGEEYKARSRKRFKENRTKCLQEMRMRRIKNPLRHQNSRLKSAYGSAIMDYRAAHPRMFAIAHPTAVHGPYIEWYHIVLEAQNGKCAISGCVNAASKLISGPGRLAVDHCHATGKIRGLLCGRCNLTLGAAEDSPEILEGLAAYARVHKPSAGGVLTAVQASSDG